MEGAATTVYAQGGRGNSRLVAWEGERTVTFTMEDALISPEGFMILSGAGLVQSSNSTPVVQHVTETVNYDATHIDVSSDTLTIYVTKEPYMPDSTQTDAEPGTSGNYAYVMLVKDGEIVSEPYIPTHLKGEKQTASDGSTYYTYTVEDNGKTGDDKLYKIVIEKAGHADYNGSGNQYYADGLWYKGDDSTDAIDFDSVIVDYYTRYMSGENMQIDITPDKFGGNYYLEASTLFRDQNGTDMPAEFVIPNCKIQSNFTFTMASSGDPSELMRLAA